MYFTFTVYATMHDGSEHRATILGHGTNYAGCLADVTARARALFPGARQIRVL